MVWERSEREHVTCLLLAGVELFPESNAKLLAERVEGLEVLLVLLLVLDLGLDAYFRSMVSIVQQRVLCWGVQEWGHTLEDANSGGEVVDAAGSLQGSSEDLNGGDKVVGEAVVEVTLKDREDRVSRMIRSRCDLVTGHQQGCPTVTTRSDIKRTVCFRMCEWTERFSLPGARKHPGHRRIPSRIYH